MPWKTLAEVVFSHVHGRHAHPPRSELRRGARVEYMVFMLVHSVYFWFKPDAAPATVAAFEAGLARLTTIPEIVSAHFGKPEATPKRAVVDDSYTWALVEIFPDLAAHDRYQAHPIHQEFLREFSGSWQRVQVYDVRASGG